MILKCKACGYTKEVIEDDVMDSVDCEICGGTMLLKDNADTLEEMEKDKAVGDNFPFIPQKEENKITTRMAEQEVKSNLNSMGASNCWYLIEAIADVELRLKYRAVFFKLGATMPEKESLK